MSGMESVRLSSHVRKHGCMQLHMFFCFNKREIDNPTHHMYMCAYMCVRARNVSGRTDFTQWKFRPEFASSNLQAYPGDFVGYNWSIIQ